MHNTKESSHYLSLYIHANYFLKLVDCKIFAQSRTSLFQHPYKVHNVVWTLKWRYIRSRQTFILFNTSLCFFKLYHHSSLSSLFSIIPLLYYDYIFIEEKVQTWNWKFGFNIFLFQPKICWDVFPRFCFHIFYADTFQKPWRQSALFVMANPIGKKVHSIIFFSPKKCLQKPH